jgi:hypothetical protein
MSSPAAGHGPGGRSVPLLPAIRILSTLGAFLPIAGVLAIDARFGGGAGQFLHSLRAILAP